MRDITANIEKLIKALPPANQQAIGALAPFGKLRAGINLSNFLLVTGMKDDGTPQGVSPDMAQALAAWLGCDIEYVIFDSPGAVADAAQDNQWDIGNIGADPARATFINFTDAYCEIESTCLVREGSLVRCFADVDQPGIKIASKNRAAYTLWLERNLKNAELVLFESLDASFDGFMEQQLDVLAGLRPRLLDDAKKIAGARILVEKFAAVQQAIGTPSERDCAGIQSLQQFVKVAIQTGFVTTLIEQHDVVGRLCVTA